MVTLNACLLPSHLRWIFRAHRLCEGLETAATRVGEALIAHHQSAPFETLHLQEVFEERAFVILAARAREVGLVHTSGFTRSGLCTFSVHPLRILHEREQRSLGEARPKAWQAIELGACVHVNVHFASEIDGSHPGRVAQASELAEWIAGCLAERSEPPQYLLVIGDTNEGEGEQYAVLARALGVRPQLQLKPSYRWLRGLVVARFDRAYLFTSTQSKGESRQGTELTGRVVTDLPDVSDHYAVRFGLPVLSSPRVGVAVCDDK